MLPVQRTSPVRVRAEIPAAAVPGWTRLYRDYVGGAAPATSYFARPWRGIAALVDEPPPARVSTHRDELVTVLAEQNRRFGTGRPTLDLVEELRQPDAVAVVTGQQAGLFGGPAYTVYKAMTAIAIARRLRESGHRAVPVFWIASEDHDFAEVASVTVADRHDGLSTVTMRGRAEDDGKPVGYRRFDDTIVALREELVAALPSTFFTPAIRELLESAYAPGLGLAEAFARLLGRLFASTGLVLFDPLDTDAKRLASPLLVRAIEHAHELATAFSARSRELVAAGYSAQLHMSDEAVGMFLLDKSGRRVSLRQRDGRFVASASQQTFTSAELLALASQHPETLSPKASLRPIVQDWLFPTIAYVGGPAEIAYFAQLQPLYTILGVPMPVTAPRWSVTILERDTVRTLDRYGLAAEAVFAGEAAVREMVASRLGGADAQRLLDSLERQIRLTLRELADSDGPLAADRALARGERKLIHQIEKLRRRWARLTVQRDDAAARRIARLHTRVLPGGKLQERSLSVLTWLVLAGPNLIEDLLEGVGTEHEGHLLVELGGVAAQVYTADRK
jgi:bacillithiol biosynthesis cysteine-adding enzyme BshC